MRDGAVVSVSVSVSSRCTAVAMESVAVVGPGFVGQGNP